MNPCTIEHEHHEIARLDAEREEMFKELAGEEEDKDDSMSWNRPTVNDHEADPSGGLIPISSELDFHVNADSLIMLCVMLMWYRCLIMQ